MLLQNNRLLLCALTVIVNMHSIEGLRILGLFPFQMRSHTTLCQELMSSLALKGHQVDVYTHIPLEKRVPNYNEFSLKGSLPGMTNNLTWDFASTSSSPVDFIRIILRASAESMCKLLLEHPYFQKLRNEPPNDPPYDLVILTFAHSHCFIHWGRFLNVPIIGVVTLPTVDWIYPSLGNPSNLAVEPSMFSTYAVPMTFFQRLNNVITYYVTGIVFDYVIRQQDKYVQQNFGPDYPSNPDAVKDFSLVLVNQHWSLNGIRPLVPAIVPVGGLHIVDHNETLSHEVQKWLDKSIDGCIYFTFGSMIKIETFPKHVIKAFFRSFKNIAPVRVLIKIVDPEVLPLKVPSNVLMQAWLPQLQILKHKNIKAFVTHAGLLSTQESIFYGVPMVAIPLFSDQRLNAAIYTRKNIAVTVDLHELTEETFTKALYRVLHDPSIRKSIEKVSNEFKDRPMSPMETAIFWVEYIARHGKHALRSPLVDMPWWQASLVDVYGFIIIVIAIISYTIKRLLTLLIVSLRAKFQVKDKKS